MDPKYAISLLQPWATLVILGAKKFETRNWKLNGSKVPSDLYIHSSFRVPHDFFEVMAREPFKQFDYFFIKDKAVVCPVGSIIGKVRVTRQDTTVDWIFDHTMHGLGKLNRKWEMEHAFGDYGPNRYAWKLEDPIRLPEPVRCKGSLGRWLIPEDVSREIDRQEQKIIAEIENSNSNG